MCWLLILIIFQTIVYVPLPIKPHYSDHLFHVLLPIILLFRPRCVCHLMQCCLFYRSPSESQNPSCSPSDHLFMWHCPSCSLLDQHFMWHCLLCSLLDHHFMWHCPLCSSCDHFSTITITRQISIQNIFATFSDHFLSAITHHVPSCHHSPPFYAGQALNKHQTMENEWYRLGKH